MTHRSLVFLALLMIAPAVFAADFGIRAGQYRDADDEFVGAEVLIDAGVLNLNPNVEYNLSDDITSGSANIDVTLDLGKFSAVTPYVGAGVGLLYVDADGGADETDLVGNLIGGIALDLQFLKPYAQLKYFRTLDEDDSEGSSDDFAVTIGLRF
jgi:opacity protein-like surface antigen